jgi:hypothetical protein
MTSMRPAFLSQFPAFAALSGVVSDMTHFG